MDEPASVEKKRLTAGEGRRMRHVDQVKRVTWIGLVLNVMLSALKFAAGLVGNSQAVVADAVHSLSDGTTDVAILVGVKYWSKPADAEHPHGHRRIETLITIFIAALLALVAGALVYNALATVEEEHRHLPGWIAFGAALVSIVSKESLYRWTIGVGKRIRSPAIVANAWHHRSDALSSIPPALAVAGARLVPAWAFLDHIGAVIVSVFIFQAAWRIGGPALKELVEAGAPAKDRERIREIALATEGVERVHAVRSRYVGSALHVDLHVMVDGDMTVRQGHDIAEVVKQRLLRDGPDLVDVVVHVEPPEDDDGP